MNSIKQHAYLLSLLGIVFLVCLLNYTPDTFLTGWDNLHPEFNFSMNIYRSLFSVWEEYQGLGLLAGMGHAADLPRQVFLYLLSPIIPMSFSRYFFHFLMLFVGTAGVFVFLKNIVFPRHTFSDKLAFLGAIFYLLNLGTAQYFFVPFEPYSMFWGFLPWELFFTIHFLQIPSRQNLLFLALINLAATAQGYVQTIFLVYVMVITLLLGSFLFYQKTLAMAKQAFMVLFVIFCMNAFWVIPNLYFTIHDVSITQNAINNRQNTQRFFDQNKYHGTLADFPLLREFYADFFEPTAGTDTYDYMMAIWRHHYENPLIALLGYSFFVLMLTGIFFPLVRRKNTSPLSVFFLLLMLLSMVIFLSDTFFFAQVNAGFRALPLVNQIFRNPFTKFIVPTIFIFSIGFSLGCAFLIQFFTRYSKLEIGNWKLEISSLIFYLLTFLVLLYGFPAFRGQFIAQQMRVKIPQSYFDLFAYMKTQDKNARIMNLPQGSYWGWGSYSWPGGGSVGSGFLWYGIEQPIMDRAFDVWSQPLENYYWQLWQALKEKNVTAFNTILDKYDITYVLFDTSYTPSDANPIKSLYLQQNDVLRKNPKLKLVKTFGTMTLYKTKLAVSTKDNITAVTNLPTVAHAEIFQNSDPAALKIGMYTDAQSNQQSDYLFPFGSLFTGRFQSEHGFSATNTSDAIIFKSSIPKGAYTLSYPDYGSQATAFPVQIAQEKTTNGVILRFSRIDPQISIQGSILPSHDIFQEVTIPLPRNSDTIILSVNNEDFFSFKPSATNQVLGTTYFLNQTLANTIRVYNGSDAKTTQLAPKDFAAGKECEPSTDDATFSSLTQNNTLTLMAKNANVCSMYKKALPDVLTNSLVQVAFDYSSSSDEFPQYCFSTADGNGCLNTKKQLADPGFAKNGHVKDFFITGEITADPTLQFRLNAKENEDKDTQKQLKLKKIFFTTYPVLASLVGDIPTPASNAASVFSIASETPDVLQVAIPKTVNARSYPNLLDTNKYKSQATQPSSLPQMGDYFLKELQTNPKTIRLSAKNTYAQFWLHIPKNHLNTGYILFMETRNEQGFPLTVNVYSPQERNKYIYTMTDKTSDFTELSYILPPQYPFDPGMEILLMSSSFNNDASVNDIRNISVYPIPYDFLTGIMLQNASYTPKPEENITSELTITKKSLSEYAVEVPSNLPANTTLVLFQGYHDGWQMYRIMNQKSGIMNTLENSFPFFFGAEMKEHVKVNGWANGWNISSDPTLLHDSRFIILFWPQYLQWFGFLLLPLPFLALFWYRNRTAEPSSMPPLDNT